MSKGSQNITGKYLSSTRTIRAGVIPYRFNPVTGELSFLLARHSSSKELGDFGGGVRKNESALQAAFREFDEETLGVFSEFYSKPEDLELCPAFIDGGSMSVIFAPVPYDFDVYERFSDARMQNSSRAHHGAHHKPLRKALVEISEVVWASVTEFRRLIRKGEHHKKIVDGLPKWMREAQSEWRVWDSEMLWTKVQGFLQRTRVIDFFERR
jgi:8-oxo-dGTP pyrophosphatase MutT (NUDIX family)